MAYVDDVRRKAEAGDVKQQLELGMLFEAGEGGTAKDDQQAVFWFRKAVEQGNPTAMYYLGLLMEKGRGCPQDIEGAMKLYAQCVLGDVVGYACNLALRRMGLSADQAFAYQREAVSIRDSDGKLALLERYLGSKQGSSAKGGSGCAVAFFVLAGAGYALWPGHGLL